MSKGGATTTGVTIPDYLKQPIVRNLNRAEQVANIGYTPYYGPDVAAMTPMQQASMQGTNQAASAFGLPSVSDPMSGMPQSQDFGGMQGYSSAPMYQQSLDALQTNRPDQYNAIESMFNPTSGGGYGGGYNDGYNGGSGEASGNGSSFVKDAGNVAGGLGALYLADKVGLDNKIGSLVGKGVDKVGGLLGGAETVVQPPLNLKNTFYQGPLNIAGTGGFGTGGGTGMLGGFGALPTMAQLTNTIMPMGAAVAAVKPFGDYIAKPFARDVMGFGNETDARREQLANFSEQSGLDDYKAAMAGGGDYSDYIESKRPPISPFQAEINAIGDAGDRQYEEEQVVNMFQTPQGQQQMSNYYANNPEFFNPDGTPSASVLAEQQRGMDAVSQYIRPTMNRDDYSLLGSGFRQTRN